MEEKADQEILLRQITALKKKEKEQSSRIRRLESAADDYLLEFKSTIDSLDLKLENQTFEQEEKLKKILEIVEKSQTDSESQTISLAEVETLTDLIQKYKRIVLILGRKNESLQKEMDQLSNQGLVLLKKKIGGPTIHHYLLATLVMVTVHLISQVFVETNPCGSQGILHFMTWVPLVMFLALLKITL